MDSRRKIILSLCLILAFLLVGTVGYVVIEHYTPLEAIYMAVITITTVGYGEIHALSDVGRIFTMFLLLSIPMGIYQDRTSRKHVLRLGLLIALIGLVIPIF
jgi:voltage-gated potassium channel